ncbi:hypothetical protein QC762_105580, partial [Podospora pseudocomata]
LFSPNPPLLSPHLFLSPSSAFLSPALFQQLCFLPSLYHRLLSIFYSFTTISLTSTLASHHLHPKHTIPQPSRSIMSTATSTSTALKRVLDLTHSNQTHPTPTIHLARALSFVALPTWPGSRSCRCTPDTGCP